MNPAPDNNCKVSVILKELTDEQIGWFAKAYTDRNGKLNIIDFTRAILRKVQEK